VCDVAVERSYSFERCHQEVTVKRRTVAWAFALALVAATGVLPGDTAQVVSIIMDGAFFIEPANVSFVIAVEPNAENRILWVEADSGALFRASEVALNGANEKRLHPFVFKSLPGGRYTLRAEVRSQSDVRGLAMRTIVVTGKGPG
jgi:hypothetical protein